ncbi:MAG TPA: hypothetical protein VF188_05760 [Longimicrobiales bacterium]
MIETWKQAWRDAVENFWRELRAGAEGEERAAAMLRELRRARAEARRAEAELARARHQLAEEREAERICRRREALARDIDDIETARIAADFAARHAERAAVAEQKVQALEAEQALRESDLREMAAQLEALDPAAGSHTADDPLEDPAEREFQRLDQDARERAAAERLEELKRRMQ